MRAALALAVALLVGACGPEFSLGPEQGSSLSPVLERPGGQQTSPEPQTPTPDPPRARDCSKRRAPIPVGAVSVQSGTGASFLGGARVGASAMVRGVNDDGGICGRPIELITRDAGDDANRAAAFVRAFAEAGAVAMAAIDGPSSLERLAAANVFERERIPLVGSWGRSPAEFSSSWAFPIGARPSIYGGAAVAHAYAMGARRFIMLTEPGSPGADDVVDGAARAASELEDAVLIRVEMSSSAERERYDLACADGCDGVIVAASPGALLSWMVGGPARPKVVTAVPEAMITPTFVNTCASGCAGFVAFSSFELPTDGRDPDHARYLDEVRAFDPSVDEADLSVLRSWLGARVLVDALARIDGRPSARGVRTALRSGSFDVGFTARPLTWRSGPEANRSVRPYALRYRGDSFAGYEPVSSWYTLDR